MSVHLCLSGAFCLSDAVWLCLMLSVSLSLSDAVCVSFRLSDNVCLSATVYDSVCRSCTVLPVSLIMSDAVSVLLSVCPSSLPFSCCFALGGGVGRGIVTVVWNFGLQRWLCLMYCTVMLHSMECSTTGVFNRGLGHT